MSDSHENVSLDQILRVLRRRRIALLACIVAGAGAGVLLATLSPQQPEATATLLIVPPIGESSGSGTGLNARAAARLVETRPVAARAARELPGERSPGDLLGAVSAHADDADSFVSITARDDDGAAAAEIANTFATAFIAARDDSISDRVGDAIEAGERELAELRRGTREHSRLVAELTELRATAAISSVEAELVDPAVPAADGDDVEPVVAGALGAAVGMLIGLVLVFALEALDPRVRTLADLPGLAGAPSLTALSSSRRRWRRRRSRSVLSAPREPFEHLRSALLTFNGRPQLRRVAVTTPTERGEGESGVAANLAVSLARLGLRVCVVDADLRSPTLAPQFGFDEAPGLCDVLRGAPLEDVVRRFEFAPDGGRNGAEAAASLGLDVLTAGGERTGVAELLGGPRLGEVLEQLEGDHDVVVIHCAPVLASGDALPLLEHASGTILVVRHSRTTRRAVSRAADVVTQANGRIVGIVATDVPRDELEAGGYGSGPHSGPAGPRHGI